MRIHGIIPYLDQREGGCIYFCDPGYDQQLSYIRQIIADHFNLKVRPKYFQRCSAACVNPAHNKSYTGKEFILPDATLEVRQSLDYDIVPEIVYERETAAGLRKALTRLLTDKEQYIIHGRFWGGRSLGDLAAGYGHHRERIRQIESRALKKLGTPDGERQIYNQLGANILRTQVISDQAERKDLASQRKRDQEAGRKFRKERASWDRKQQEAKEDRKAKATARFVASQEVRDKISKRSQVRARLQKFLDTILTKGDRVTSVDIQLACCRCPEGKCSDDCILYESKKQLMIDGKISEEVLWT